jgi:hypothetical protein
MIKSTLRGNKDPNHILNRKNEKGQTLLYVACKYGNIEMAKCLVMLGADHMVVSVGELPIQVSERWNHIELFEYLLKSGIYDSKVISACFKKTESKKTAELVRKYYKGIKLDLDKRCQFNCCLLIFSKNK